MAATSLFALLFLVLFSFYSAHGEMECSEGDENGFFGHVVKLEKVLNKCPSLLDLKKENPYCCKSSNTNELILASHCCDATEYYFIKSRENLPILVICLVVVVSLAGIAICCCCCSKRRSIGSQQKVEALGPRMGRPGWNA